MRFYVALRLNVEMFCCRKVIRAYQDSWDNRCRLLFCCMGNSDRNRVSSARDKESRVKEDKTKISERSFLLNQLRGLFSRGKHLKGSCENAEFISPSRISIPAVKENCLCRRKDCSFAFSTKRAFTLRSQRNKTLIVSIWNFVESSIRSMYFFNIRLCERLVLHNRMCHRK